VKRPARCHNFPCCNEYHESSSILLPIFDCKSNFLVYHQPTFTLPCEEVVVVFIVVVAVVVLVVGETIVNVWWVVKYVVCR